MNASLLILLLDRLFIVCSRRFSMRVIAVTTAVHLPAMLTRPQVDEAEAKSMRPRPGQNCINFSAKFYISTPISPINEIFGRFSTGLEKFRLKTGFNLGTL